MGTTRMWKRPAVRSAAISALAMAVVATTAATIGTGRADATPAGVTEQVRVGARVEVDLLDQTCDNTGSTVELSGSITLTGQGVRLTFKNNVKGTHTVEVVDQLEVEVTPFDEHIEFPKQPAFGGVGGNPWISLQLRSGDTALTPPVVLGRCVQGTMSHVSRDVLLPADMALLLTTLECSNKGSSISLDMSSADAGIDALLLFDNNRNRVVHERQAAADAMVSLVGDRTIRKGGNVNAAGGNPLVYAEFVDGAGAALGSEMFLGRCNRLGG